MVSTPAVSRISGFVLQVRDPERSARFYCEGLGFQDERRDGADAVVSLGGVRLRLAAAPDGRVASAPSSANAADFQHFALRVRDMKAAFTRVAAFDPSPISRDGPQRLPPADGSVTAWKFRDPDGHPLELLQAAKPSQDGPTFQAIDHTALACADLAASLAFYARLGFSQGASSHNHGAPQDRLDGLRGVDLHIATVYTPDDGPHIELLHYRRPTPAPRPAPAEKGPFVETWLQAGDGGGGALRDPDGHSFELG